MSFLSAASMESYARAYPFLTRLHILQEIETGSQLVSMSGVHGSLLPRKSNCVITRTQMETQTQVKSLSQSVTGGTGFPLFNFDEQEVERNRVFQELHWDQRLDLMSPYFRERAACLAVRRCILGNCSRFLTLPTVSNFHRLQ